MHAPTPVPVEYVPAEQLVQLVPPAVGLYWPARHSVQLGSPRPVV